MRLFRWQLLIALLGTVLIATVLGYAALSLTTGTAPEQGGAFVEGVIGNPQWINPILCQYNQVDCDLSALIFSGLTRLNEKGEVVPDLAESWVVSADGLTYTFRLRQGVLWHDGAPFTSRDVLFTVKAMQHADYQGAPHLARFWSDIAVVADNDYTVRFLLPAPLAPFLDYTTIGLLPEHLLYTIAPGDLPKAEFNVQPVGAGRFRVAEVSAQGIALLPNENAAGPAPHLERLEFRFYPDAQSLLEAYKRGEIVSVSRVSPDLIPEAAALPNLDLYSARMAGYVLIYLNLDDAANLPFFTQREVRQALLQALDRQKLVDEVLNGQGIVANSPILPETWAHWPGLAQHAYDPARAAELLDAAGWVDRNGDGIRENEGRTLSFRLVTNDDPLRKRLAESVAAQWRKIGVEATAESVSFARLVGEFLATRRFDAVLTGLELPGDPDPYPLWHSTQAKTPGQNYGGFALRAADEVLEAARTTTDVNRRIALYQQFQQLFADEVPALLLYYPVYTYGVDDRVQGVQVLPLNGPADRFATVNDWFIETRRVLLGRNAN
ncbi:MAG: peptide ABC transporter substrate-binding protein [Chloroflexi bacterium]|nr:peptide ABC transporter substrate-binding protein [Chloroflexota bacterium]